MPRNPRKKVLAKVLREQLRGKKVIDTVHAYTAFFHAISSHLLDKLNYIGKKRERMRNAIAHYERLSMAGRNIEKNKPVTIRILRVILKKMIEETRIILRAKATGLSLEDERFFSNIGRRAQQNLITTSAQPAGGEVFVPLQFLDNAFDVHHAYMYVVMGEKDLKWYIKNSGRLFNAGTKKIFSQRG